MAIRTEREWQLFSLVYNKEIAERLTGLQGMTSIISWSISMPTAIFFSATTYEVEKG